MLACADPPENIPAASHNTKAPPSTAQQFSSTRSAQGHVANIFNKLGVNSRTAAVTDALVQGLVEPPDAPAG